MKGAWLVGVVAVAVLGYITLNTLRTERLDPLARGTPLPRFAMPLARVAADRDARVSADACQVRGPDVLNSCDLRRPLVLAFVVTDAGDCADQVDVLDRVAPRFPRVGFAAIVVGGDPGDLRALVRRRGWTVPVGYDSDGAVSIEYGLRAVCPLLTFGDRKGRVAGSSLGVLDEAALVERVEALVAERPLP